MGQSAMSAVIQNTPMSGSGWTPITTERDLQSCTITQPKLGDPCQNCRKRKSTTQWVGDGGALAQTHGFYQWWCDVCVLTEQLEHARERAAAIPDLQRQLRNAKRRKS